MPLFYTYDDCIKLGKNTNNRGKCYPFHSQQQLKEAVANTTNGITRGMGRCYGDSALHSTIIQTTEFNQIQSFDEKTALFVVKQGFN